MTATATDYSREREREVRLGIVLYGGVSLAIYENGVAQELFRAVKGEGVYSLIKELTESDIVVDIVSGTSAGGINGIMLGYALANGRDFKSCARLWREDGDILRLLRDINQADAASVLDSRGYFQERLEAAFDGMPAYLPSGNQRIASEIAELDLFVTGTDVQGDTYTVFDDLGHPIDVKEHRAMFQLSYRMGRKNEFEPGRSAQLAKLARTTSCFPVAFEPVQVTTEADDELLRLWGKLDTRENIFFLDGGILNNKPFSYTIDAIARRMAERDVERMLLYVEPDPERFQHEKPLSATPNVAQSAIDALIGIPGYQSISADLQAIADHNDRVQLYRDILECVPEPDGKADCLGRAAANRASQPDVNAWNAIKDAPRRCMYQKARLNQIRDRALEGILKRAGQRELLLGDEKHAAVLLVESFNGWNPKGDNALTATGEATLLNFDVYFRMRRLLHLSYFIKKLTYPTDKKLASDHVARDSRKHLRRLRRRLNHQFKLLEEIQFAMETAIDKAPIPWKDLKDKDTGDQNARAAAAEARWLMAQSVLVTLLDTDGLPVLGAASKPMETELPEAEAEKQQREVEYQERLDLMTKLKRRIDKAGEEPPAATPSPFKGQNLLLRCDELERDIIRNFAPGGAAGEVAQRYCNFLVVDSYLFPMQRLARLESVDVIHTVRISPIDAQRAYSARTLDAKLCGTALANFGGFLKRSWRANDTMWGRLDAVCQLIECLVTDERMKKVSPPPANRDRLGKLFPNAPDGDLDRIAELWPKLGSADKATFSDFLDSLVRAAQAEILHEEVPRVIDAAIRQHAEWNQFPIDKPARQLISSKQVWQISPSRLDSAVTSYASDRLALQTMPAGGWPRYFDDMYAVGSETWKSGIPAPILAEIATHAALVLRTCLIGTAGTHAAKIRGSIPYRLVDIPMVWAYRLVRLQRTSPEYFWVTAVILALSGLLLAVQIPPVRKDLFGKSSEAPEFLWWAVPALIALITAALIYFRRTPAQAAVVPANGILEALLGVAGLEESQKSSLGLSTALWPNELCPGAIMGPNGPTLPPDLAPPMNSAGPVLNFCAQETADANVQDAIACVIGLPIREVTQIKLRVERLRVIEPPEKELKEWLYGSREALKLDPSGKRAMVVRSVYEGTVALTVSLSTKPEEFSARYIEDLNGRHFRIQRRPTDDVPNDIAFVSTEPLVFAYRAVHASIRPAEGETHERVDLSEIPAPPGFFGRAMSYFSKPK